MEKGEGRHEEMGRREIGEKKEGEERQIDRQDSQPASQKTDIEWA